MYPTSGGTYIYGRERRGEWWGFVAGWGFVISKTASCAAIALTFAAYAVPGPWWAQRLVAVAGVGGLAALNYRGVRKTAVVTRVLVAATLVALSVVVGIAVGGGSRRWPRWAGAGQPRRGLRGAAGGGAAVFAFAGYARIATMGEEVRDPERTIPSAIPIALGITVVVYLIVGGAALLAAGPARLALFEVLVYYGIANAAAFTQPANQRRWPRTLNILGVTGCGAGRHSPDHRPARRLRRLRRRPGRTPGPTEPTSKPRPRLSTPPT